MNTINKCYYDDNNNTIVAKFETGNRIIYSCSELEEDLKLTIATRARLEFLEENNPTECIQMYLNKTLQQYLDNYQNALNHQEKIMKSQLEKVYDKSTAELVAHELTVYGDSY